MDVMDNTNGAWAKASHMKYEEPERQSMLGQNRHAYSESAFRDAAVSSGLSCTSPHTKPAGGRYSLVSSDNIYFIRSNIQAHCGIPKPTAFRKSWASLNRWLDPVQLDIFSEKEIPDNTRLCALIVSTYNRKNEDQTVPAFLGLGIPDHDFSRWKLLKPLEDVFALYHDLDVTSKEVYEKQPEIIDKAIPRLKKRD
tara:strand:+ start:5046 stop:5633 length:588 start_codon:yes stop_codon:yes gene_type:complete